MYFANTLTITIIVNELACSDINTKKCGSELLILSYAEQPHYILASQPYITNYTMGGCFWRLLYIN